MNQVYYLSALWVMKLFLSPYPLCSITHPLVVLAYVIGFLIGEQIRDQAYGGSRKWKLYSGLFILLKRKIRLTKVALLQVLKSAFMIFRGIVMGHVRTHV